MSCEILENFRYATENLDQKTFREASFRSIWMNVPKRGVLPLGQGTNFVTFGIAHNEPTTDTGIWDSIDMSQAGLTNLEYSDTSTELCANTWSDVYWGAYELSYAPEMSQLRGPEVCERQLLFPHNVDDFITGYVDEMTKRAKRQWEHNYAYHHRRLGFKAVIVSDFEANIYEQDALTGLPEPTGGLTQEVLEFMAARLAEDGATNPDENGYVTLGEAGPIYSLGIGMYESQILLRSNANQRVDYHFADPNVLIARVGATRVIGNFRHVIDQRPRRYTWSGNAFTRVPYYTADTSVSIGTGYKINPSWRSAPYESVDILSPDLFTSQVPPIKTSAGGITVGGGDYNGNWQFITGAYKWRAMTDTVTTTGATQYCDDPLDSIGRHFAQFMHAAKPNPLARYKYGGTIYFKRCMANKVALTTCSS